MDCDDRSVCTARAWRGRLANPGTYGPRRHGSIREAGLPRRGLLANALMDMYGRCGSLQDAWKVFEEVTGSSQGQDIVPWNVMIGALSRNGHSSEAFRLFKTMNLEGVKPEAITVVSVLDFCSIPDGKMVHASILGTGLEKQIRVQNALITMYSEGGCLQRARDVFNTINNPNVVSWSAVIAAYAECARSSEALKVFQDMTLQGELPDYITFIAIISACAHAGLLKTGIEFFVVMRQDHGIEPSADHFMCIADLLGRVGKLELAEDVLSFMPFEPTPVAWTSLLGCCKTSNDLERAQRISQKIFGVKEGASSGPYVLLSNVTKAVT
ncbi:pentatricopeptide repeat-containing protein At3g57430, chloroplastic [Selaginella moellendorffii]|uniref:pentatricopeptide repeat-containing protein At3g57430, chloroplastic n=1 Tax=Selaginella moellendorffii TaxID=88036 RepID=UPI000D1D060D|nr:pentatricopeptide repeat-containing protein At3g57430, chloroplastic [Selaginella moellendorffii]|eukprot:XP_024520963.1 pentatricopeptide repeat-containing protein At3g57430, chloroplastic [Selaginella moellendorffii]